jgi:hypothetical protein
MRMHETTLKQGSLLKGLLFDPYKRQLSLVEVRNDIRTWHKLLRCDCVDVNRVIRPILDREAVDIWFDDEFLLKDPVGPGLRLTDSDDVVREYHGYCLMLSSDSDGNSTDFTLFSEMPKDASTEIIALMLMGFQLTMKVSWENWERRLPKDTFLDLQMRTPEIEISSDDFRMLAVLD